MLCVSGCTVNCHRAEADAFPYLLEGMVASSKGDGFSAVSRSDPNHHSKFLLATRHTQSCLCVSSLKPAGSSLPLYRYSAIRKKLDELDQITHQTLLDLYDYNMSLARSDWSTASTRKRTSRSLLHHVQRHPLRRQKRDNLVSLPENSPSVDKNDWKIGFILVRSQDIFCPTHASLCLGTSVLLDTWSCPSPYRWAFVTGFC